MSAWTGAASGLTRWWAAAYTLGLPAGVGAPAVEEAVLAPDELVGDERGDEVERRHALGLCLAQARFERGGHAGEAELAEGAVEFGEGHSSVSLSMWRSMRSR